MKRILLIAALALVSITSQLSADSYAPSPYCSKPNKPYEFTDEWELENFNDEVERYKRCISDFVDEQNNAVRQHQRAAEEAIDEWNNFVSRELS
jgi:hypothetical protein